VTITKEQTLIDLPEYIVNIDLQCQSLPSEIKFKTQLESIVIDDYITLSHTSLTNLRYLKNLKKLSIIGKLIDDFGVCSLVRLNQLTEVNLEGCCKLTDDALFNLSMMKNLQKLNISSTKITEVGIEYFYGNTTLTELNVLDCNIKNKLVGTIFNNIVNLRKLHLDICSSKEINQLTNLTSLELSVGKLTYKLMKEINSLIKLQELTLSYQEINQSIKIELKNLISLSLSYLEEPEEIDLQLINTNQLKSLYLDNQPITQSSLETISKNNQLTHLTFLHDPFDKSSDLEPLQQMTRLKYLEMSSDYDDNCYYDDQVIEDISRIKSLKRLKINCLSDEQLKLLEGIKVSADVQ
jgi:hypothetical protein